MAKIIDCFRLLFDGTPAPVEQGTGAGMLKDPKAFFAALRKSGLLGPALEQSEVDGINAIVRACSDAGWPLAYTAYALSTAFHETAGTMQPIRERGSAAYLTALYDVKGKNPTRARKMGNVQPGDGVRYCGRGYVQLTWRCNYERAGIEVGADLVRSPDLAMRPDIAAQVLVLGMREGWFTGRDLADDLPDRGLATHRQFVLSRDIINGRDKAEKIADEAITFQSALAAGGWPQ